MALWQWSTTPANNATAATAINWAEGQPPSSVNDSARQMMADVATWYQNGPEWLNYGLTPTYVNATQFTVNGNQTATYSVGRRVRAFVTAGTIYGTVTASSFSSQTTVTVAWDSGNLDNGVSEVDVGFLNPAYSSLPSGLSPTFLACSVTGPIFKVGSASQNSEIDISITNSNTAGGFFLNPFGTAGFYDTTRSSIRWSCDISGNFTVSGIITANSDERLKSDWEDLPDDIIERVASNVLSGTFKRISTGKREAGVGAASLKEIFPETVLKGDEYFSVAYGNAALTLVVKLCQRIVKLEKRLEALEA